MKVLENKTLDLLKQLNEGLIVEASKKEILINKVGLSEDNAELLDNLCGPLSVWMANKIIDAYVEHYGLMTNELSPKELRERTIELMNNRGLSAQKTIIPGIMDWIRVGLNGNLGEYKQLTFPELLAESKKWHDELGVGDGDINYVEKNPIVLDFRDDEGNGFYWTDLETNDSSEECDRMGHCGRTNRYNTILSLREVKPLNKKYKLNKSHLTAAVGDSDGILYQLKGPKNSKPKEEFHQYIEPLFYVLGGGGEEEDYLIRGFGNEYNSENDFKLSDLPEESIRKIYGNRPELFDTRSLKRKLNQMGVIELPPVNYNVTIDISPDELGKYVDGDWIERRWKDKDGRTRTVTIFEMILSGDGWELWYNDTGEWKSSLNYYVDSDNEGLIKEYLNKLAKDNDVDVSEMSIEEMIEELDDDYIVRNAIASATSDAESYSYINYLYSTLKDAVEELGDVVKMDDEGVIFNVDVEQFLSMDEEWVDELFERCDDEVDCVFNEMIYDDEIEKPTFRPDDRWYPDVDERNFNEMLTDRLMEHI